MFEQAFKTSTTFSGKRPGLNVALADLIGHPRRRVSIIGYSEKDSEKLIEQCVT
jgi:hypothetical protein